MVRAMCGVQLKDRKRSTDLMLTLGLNETIDNLPSTCTTHVWSQGSDISVAKTGHKAWSTLQCVQSSDFAGIEHCLDGGLFNL